MFARACLIAPRGLTRFGVSSSVRLAQPGMRSPSVAQVVSRSYMVYFSGNDCDQEIDDEKFESADAFIENIGGDEAPYWRKVCSEFIDNSYFTSILMVLFCAAVLSLTGTSERQGQKKVDCREEDWKRGQLKGCCVY